MALALVLSVGLDPDLMATRSLVLQSAGYAVVSAHSIKEAVDRFQVGDFDLVLLCQSIPAKERDRLTCWVRASGSRIPMVSVSGQLCEDDCSTGAAVGSHPEALLLGIKEALTGAAAPAAGSPTLADQLEVAATPVNKQPSSGDGYKGKIKPIKERLVPLARTG